MDKLDSLKRRKKTRKENPAQSSFHPGCFLQGSKSLSHIHICTSRVLTRVCLQPSSKRTDEWTRGRLYRASPFHAACSGPFLIGSRTGSDSLLEARGLTQLRSPFPASMERQSSGVRESTHGWPMPSKFVLTGYMLIKVGN